MGLLEISISLSICLLYGGKIIFLLSLILLGLRSLFFLSHFHVLLHVWVLIQTATVCECHKPACSLSSLYGISGGVSWISDRGRRGATSLRSQCRAAARWPPESNIDSTAMEHRAFSGALGSQVHIGAYNTTSSLLYNPGSRTSTVCSSNRREEGQTCPLRDIQNSQLRHWFPY